MSFNAKKPAVFDRQLKVQSLSIPLSIVANATPASVVPSSDEGQILFLKTQGVNQFTAALDSGETLPSLAAQVDASGTFCVMVKVGELLDKVVSAKLILRNGFEIVACAVAGLTSSGDKFCLNCDVSSSLASTNLDACLEVQYVVKDGAK